MPLVLSEPAARVVQITIDQQDKMNAMSRAMMAELCEIWDRLDSDPGCRAVVLTGAGAVSYTHLTLPTT